MTAGTAPAGPGLAARVVIAGLGTIGQVHARVLEAIPGADVVAGVDTGAGHWLSDGNPVMPAGQSLFMHQLLLTLDDGLPWPWPGQHPGTT